MSTAAKEQEGVYVLYGSYASYFTAKSRSYLRKQCIPFIERPPSDPRFREYVRPQSQNHRIPQLEAPDGTVVQDSSAIFDYLEARFPLPVARPPGIKQQWACRMLESLIDPALLYMAWHFRWNFMEENYAFVGREFGRSFRPRGNDDEVDHYGRVIADRMEGHRKAIGITKAHYGVMDRVYEDVLNILEHHFTTLPYLFGGLPSIADHALMGPLFGHLARDPVPAMRMKQLAPRVFRWTEHMNAPEIVLPELHDEPTEYAADDRVPETALALLRMLIADAGERLALTANAFERWTREHPDHPSCASVSSTAIDEPSLGRATTDYRGVPLDSELQLQHLWVLQRAQEWRDGLAREDQKTCDELLASVGGGALIDLPRPRRLIRVDNRLAVA